MKINGFIVLFILLCTKLVFSADFRYLRTQEGLYDGEVTAIAQDSSGVMWIGSYSGLTRYDGTNISLYRPELGNAHSLPDKKVKSLFVDSDNNLWIASARSLSVYDSRKDCFNTINFERNNLSELNILFLNEYDNQLVIHTVEGFYFFPQNQIGNLNYKAKLHQLYISGSTGTPYFYYSYSYNNQLFVLNHYNSDLTQIYRVSTKKINNDTLSIELVTELSYNVNSMKFVPNENNIYMATSNGLRVYSLSTKRFEQLTYFKGNNINNVIFTSNNTIFCSGNEPELYYLDLHTGLTGAYKANPDLAGSLLNNNILNLFEDFSGNLWIGHQGQGISILNLHKKKFKTFRRSRESQNKLFSNTVLSFAEDENEYIIGCRKGGLNFIKKEDLENERPIFSFLPLNYVRNDQFTGVWDISKFQKNKYWLATESGIYILTKESGKWKLDKLQSKPQINGLVWKIFIDKNQNIWAGTYDQGLLLIPNPERNTKNIVYQFVNDVTDSTSISDNYVKEIFLDSKNRFWIGTFKGLNCLSENYKNIDLSGAKKPDLKFKRFVAKSRQDNFLNNNEINGIIENYDGKIWVSTQGGGINILDPKTNSFRHILKENGLPTNDVYGMVPDSHGTMWISTGNGLVSHNVLKDSLLFTDYDMYDGIQGQTFMVGSYYKANNGMLFFGGDNGFTAFHPQQIKLNNAKPKIVFSNLFYRSKPINVGDTIANKFVLEKALNYTDKIVLPFKKNYFEIIVATPHYEAPEKNKFSYKLLGLMKNWSTVYTSKETIEFANLAFGDYKLLVKAISSDNAESEIKTLDIIIAPPWYRTWYMTLIFVLLSAAIVFGLIFIFINRQKLIYQNRLDEMTISNNESKMMFLTNIAHELRTPLSLIIAPIEDLIQINEEISPHWKNHLQLINRNSKYLLRLINQIIDFRKLNAGMLKLNLSENDLVRLTKDVVMNFKGYESKRNIKLYLHIPSEKIMMPFDPQKIEEVLYNLLSNAFKNTFDNHSITVSMHHVSGKNESGDNNLIRISVFNQGHEINEDQKDMVFERFYKINENVEGAGIGLSFAKSLVELHGGKIWFESIKNEGVVFHVDLPLNKKPNLLNPNKLLPKKPMLIQSEKINSELQEAEENTKENTILIVEDNEELLDFLYLVLSRKYKCIKAENGTTGWKIVRRQKPSIVVSDIIMPNTDGLELCKLIKTNNETCHIPVILLSAKNTEEQKIEGFKNGADAYVTKPFDINLLLTQISRLIKNRELIREKYRTQNFMVEIKNNVSKDEEFVQQVRNLLEENIGDPEFNVNRLSQNLNISTTQLYRKLKTLTGYSPVEFIRIIKLQKAYNLLSQRDKTVKEVCYLTGFNNLSYFIKCFKEQFNTTPACFRDSGNKQKNDKADIIKIT